MLLLAATTCFLAGLSWVVQLVVYPAFARVGAAEWPAYHEAHSRAMALAVGPVWALQGVVMAVVLVRDPGWDTLLLGVLAAAPVALTVGGAVPVHTRLTTQDPLLLRRLQRVHTWRTAAWTLGAVASLLLLSSG